jgi:L-serine dehydratase
LVNIKSSKPFTSEVIDSIKCKLKVDEVILVNPVVPVISGNESEIPFTTLPSLILYAEKESLSLGELGLIYERCQSGLTSEQLFDQMRSLREIIENSIKIGLNGTHYKDCILHQQAHLIDIAAKSGRISKNTLINQLITNVTVIMESKSGMEVIVANPTAGSCGTVGGAIKTVSEDLKSSSDEIINAYFAAGLAGVYFAQGPDFSAEEHGCQVECGAASGMAAAGIAQLFGGTAKQAIDAAAMAVQNSIGLVCDPVADRVEVPCLGKNVNAAMNAFSSATMACSRFDAVIPYEEVIQTVSRVSKQMPSCVKCTGEGGLALTHTAVKLKMELEK